MVKHSKQDWQTGSIVKVGFLTLRVVSCKPVKDSLPDIYTLESLDGRKHYEFIPQSGLVRVD
jgi:hypothetical protein